MPQLPAARDGGVLTIKGRDVAFSFFPVRFRARGWTLSDTVFAVSPWAVMQGTVDDRLDGEAHEEATAFLSQARDFYVTASERLSANPLLFYYAFLNLGKALLRVRGLEASLDHAHHGLGVRNLSDAGSTPGAAAVRVHDDNDKVYVFPELFGLIEDHQFADGHELPVDDLLSQVVVGHRQWRDASDREERFIVVTDAELMQTAAPSLCGYAFSSIPRTSRAMSSRSSGLCATDVSTDSFGTCGVPYKVGSASS